MNKLEMAIQYRKSGKLEEARSLLLDLITEGESQNPSIWYQCAWVHDNLGKEREAIPFYKQALEFGLSGEDRQGALLGLGSTYRTLGMYENSKEVFEMAIKEYPERREFQVFYAMVRFNLKEYNYAMEILLKQLIETSNDEGIQSYHKAIHFYSDKLDHIWE